jgi:hypothetical protein
MQINFKPVDPQMKLQGYEYENFITQDDVVKFTRTADGNIYVIDREGRLFNVHPCVTFRYNRNKGINEHIYPSFPVRWQVTHAYDVPKELK